MNRTVDERKNHRMPCRRVLHNPPDADWECDVVIQKVCGNSIVTFRQDENKDFREKREIVEKEEPCESHNSVSSGRFVKMLTSGRILH